MTVGGWILMVMSVGGAVSFLTWCLVKLFSTPGSSEHIHSQADIETPDTRET